MKKSLPCDKLFKLVVRKESNCKKCIHDKICRYNIGDFCRNYEFERPTKIMQCNSCLHRDTRFPDHNIPCFRCKYFRRKLWV